MLFDAKKINDIWNAKALNLSAVEQGKILQAVQLLLARQKLPVSVDEEVPVWLEEKYAAELPEVFRTGDLRSPVGDHLGSHAVTLPGAWQLFYVRPLDGEGRPDPEIRCQLAVFGRARPESTATSFLLISPAPNGQVTRSCTTRTCMSHARRNGEPTRHSSSSTRQSEATSTALRHCACAYTASSPPSASRGSRVLRRTASIRCAQR